MYEDNFDIYPTYEAFYIESMLWHTKSAIRSIEVIESWIQIVKDGNENVLEVNKDDVFSHLQNIIQQSGALSRYLWPVQKGENKEHHRRGLKLRASLNIKGDSTLKNRTLRNQVEHFDELLDIYLKNITSGHIFPSIIDYDEGIKNIKKHIFKAFYITPMIFVLLGEKYQLLPIIKELRHMHTALLQCKKNGHRLP